MKYQNPEQVEIVLKYIKEVQDGHHWNFLEDLIHPEYPSAATIDSLESDIISNRLLFGRPKPGVRGPEYVKQRVRKAFEWANHRTEILNVAEADATVIISYIMHINAVGPFMGFPPPNRSIPVKGFTDFTFKDGKIIDIRIVLDFITYIQEAGILIQQEANQEKIEEYIQNLRNLKILPDKELTSA